MLNLKGVKIHKKGSKSVLNNDFYAYGKYETNDKRNGWKFMMTVLNPTLFYFMSVSLPSGSCRNNIVPNPRFYDTTGLAT